MEDHINTICTSSYYHLQNIRYLQSFLSPAGLETIVHAFITSRLDYCNSLLYGLPDNTIRKLQCIQNWAARIISNTKKSKPITPVLRKLHWLPMKELLVYKSLNGFAPSYLSHLIAVKQPEKSLCSSYHLCLEIPPSCLESYGENSFTVAGPIL